MKKIEKILNSIRQEGGILRKPACYEKITAIEKYVGEIPSELKKFYSKTNGLEFNSWRILPIYDETDKKTWDSLERANQIQKTKFSVTESILKDFFIFSEIRGGKCVLYNKKNSTIWFEDVDEYAETDLTLVEFLNLMFLEEKI